MNALFICYSYQKIHFLNSHAEEIKKRGGVAEFYLLDSNVNVFSNASRRGVLDIPFQVLLIHKLLRKTTANLVITITPKAGLILLLAKFIQRFFLAKKIFHVHWFTGQVWCNDVGFRRLIKKVPDKLLSKYSNIIFLDSWAQVDFLKKNNLILRKYYIPGRGSICGVDNFQNNFDKNLFSENLNILRIGIVGRICEDKGIPEICWWINNNKIENVVFKFFGSMDFDSQGSKDKFLKFLSENDNGVEYHGNTSDKNKIYNSIDVLLLCSRREGFSTVLIEAQLYGKPVIVRNIYGVKDSYINTVTGFEFSEFQELSYIINILKNTELRQKIGKDARKFVRDNFLRANVIDCIVSKYEELVGSGFKY